MALLSRISGTGFVAEIVKSCLPGAAGTRMCEFVRKPASRKICGRQSLNLPQSTANTEVIHFGPLKAIRLLGSEFSACPITLRNPPR